MAVHRYPSERLHVVGHLTELWAQIGAPFPAPVCAEAEA